MALLKSYFDFIKKLVFDHSGNSLEDGKDYLVESRLFSLASDNGFASVEALLNALQAKSFGDLHVRVVEAMLTGETKFFRDQHPFDSLRENILPEIIERKKDSREINIWNCACSTGQEPYSLAMMIREHFPLLLNWKLNILASDISQKALNKAKQGVYHQFDIDRGLPENYKNKYFKKVADGWQLNSEVRNMISFQEINIAKALPNLPMMDLLFMRNVLIYFERHNKQEIILRVMKNLDSNGYMFLGGSEAILGLNVPLVRTQVGKSDCYRHIK